MVFEGDARVEGETRLSARQLKWKSQGRIYEFILGAKTSSPVESWGRSPIESRARSKRPRIEGEARVKGAKRLRNEAEAQTEGEAGGWKVGSGEGARLAPPQKIFEKSNL